MDKLTLEYYAHNAAEIAVRYESVPSALEDYFPIAFAKGGKILDIGFGSGRDLISLIRQGFNAYGVDPTAQLVEIAERIHPQLGGRILVGGLPDLGIPFGGAFDGVLCCAILMHLEAATLIKSIVSIRESLKREGRILMSVPIIRTDINENQRDHHGRLFVPYTSNQLKYVFKDQGFELINEWGNDDSFQRDGIKWMTHLYQLYR